MPDAEPKQPHNGHKTANGRNGSNGGAPLGNQNGAKPRPPCAMPTPENTAAIIEQTALAVLQGRSPYNASALIRPCTDEDRRQLTRFTGIAAEEFTRRLAARLRALADLTVDRVHQHLSADRFKPHELSFLLSVTVDKLKAIDGANAVHGANVSIQVNNFGPQTKEDIIARLTGQVFDLPPTAAPTSQLMQDEQAAYLPSPGSG